MPAKIRLQRQGKKGHPYFHIIVADGRAPRDGKYIERLGFYNPNTDPATIEVDVDGAVKWLNNGAQPTDTARAILGYKGVLYKNHLLKGVKKGAFDEAEAEKRFETWLKEKQEKVDAKKLSLVDADSKRTADRLQAEKDKNEQRAAAIAAANTPAPEVEVAPEATDTPAETAEGEALVAEANESTTAEAPAAEEPKAEEPEVEEPKAEEPKAEEPKVEEPKAEEPKAEEPKAEEPKAEEPKAEEPKAEEPKAEEPKAEEPKAEEPKVEEPKAEEPKVEEPKADEPKAEAKEKEEKK